MCRIFHEVVLAICNLIPTYNRCTFNQGNPKTTGASGQSKTENSEWEGPTTRLIKEVLEVMDKGNVTSITTILLLGLQLPRNIAVLMFCILLLISGVTICGNILIITVVACSKTLHCPMYFFLSQLSVLDILLVMDILPSMIHTVLSEVAIIIFSACITQLYFFGLAEGVEMLLLTVMSYDRYLAICKPLHYTLIMTHEVCWRTVIACWILETIVLLNTTFTILKLHFCGPNVIDHFFCDLDPILKLSCTDTTMVQLEIKLIGSIFSVAPFCIIIVSYIYIIITIFEIPSVTGRKKAFSTCSSHLTVVVIFYGTIISVYMVPRTGQLQYIDKFLSLLYTVVTPMMNPIIYSLRNKDLKNAIRRIISAF
ncbi:olfactory receptor 1E16-like [Gastrophryne carolinensis]